MDAGGLGRSQAAGVDQRAEVVLPAQREAVAVPLEACEVDQVVGLRHAGGHHVRRARHVGRPDDGRALVACGVVRAALVVVAEAHAGKRALRAELHHMRREDAARVVHRDVARRYARVLHERQQQRTQKNRRRIAHGAVLVRAERARAVHVRRDGDPLARPIAARAPGARVVRLEQHAPSGRRIVRARRRSHAVVHHAPDRVLVEMLALPPVARPVPGHGRRVAHPGHAPRPCAHAAATRLVRREYGVVRQRLGGGGGGRFEHRRGLDGR